MGSVRLLGLDYGKKRIGLALSDPMGWSAQPIGFLLNDSKILDQLSALVRKHDVSEVVLGYPLSLSGKEGESAKEVAAFAKKLEAAIGIPVHLWDERFTTSEAENLLISGDVRREKRKEVRDSIAASLILQGFMQVRKT
jgi:putative holliday junction resolvase